MFSRSTTPEHPPEDLAAFRKIQAEKRGLGDNAREILECIRAMPHTMQQLAWVQITTWLGLFCMWLYFPVAVPRNVFGATDPQTELYTQGATWVGGSASPCIRRCAFSGLPRCRHWHAGSAEQRPTACACYVVRPGLSRWP
jgi:hypothetical protein